MGNPNFSILVVENFKISKNGSPTIFKRKFIIKQTLVELELVARCWVVLYCQILQRFQYRGIFLYDWWWFVTKFWKLSQILNWKNIAENWESENQPLYCTVFETCKVNLIFEENKILVIFRLLHKLWHLWYLKQNNHRTWVKYNKDCII